MKVSRKVSCEGVLSTKNCNDSFTNGRSGRLCVTLKKARVCKRAFCRYTRGRFHRTHRGVLNLHTGLGLVKGNACRVITCTRRSPNTTSKPYPFEVRPVEICSASAILKETAEGISCEMVRFVFRPFLQLLTKPRGRRPLLAVDSSLKRFVLNFRTDPL